MKLNEARDRAAARHWGSLRYRAPFPCVECGTTFDAASNGLFCSKACGLKHWRKQRRQQAQSVLDRAAGLTDASDPA